MEYINRSTYGKLIYAFSGLIIFISPLVEYIYSYLGSDLLGPIVEYSKTMFGVCIEFDKGTVYPVIIMFAGAAAAVISVLENKSKIQPISAKYKLIPPAVSTICLILFESQVMKTNREMFKVIKNSDLNKLTYTIHNYGMLLLIFGIVLSFLAVLVFETDIISKFMPSKETSANEYSS